MTLTHLEHSNHLTHEILLCIQTYKRVDDERWLKQSDQLYLKSIDEMYSLFRDQQSALDNTLAIAEQCNVELEFGKTLLPAFPLPEKYKSSIEYLRTLSSNGLKKRYSNITKEIMNRYEYELGVT